MMNRGVFSPGCGMQLQAELWEPVNVTVDPDLRVRLFRGELNVVHCVTCDSSVALPVPLMDHDSARRFAVQHVPIETLADPRRQLKLTPDGTVECPPSIAQQYAASTYLLAPHVVFSNDEMIRYIEFWEALAVCHDDPRRLEVASRRKQSPVDTGMILQ